MLASVLNKFIKVINLLQNTYQIPDPLPWAEIAGPLAAAEDAVARLDERLAKSSLRAGWIARTHFSDAAASLWLDGELVHLEDLVLHDAHMDIRVPTHELTRAHTMLRARRRIAAAEADWALSPAGLDVLRGREGAPPLSEENDTAIGDQFDDGYLDDGTDEFSAEFAAIEAVVMRSQRALAQIPVRRNEGDLLIYDLDWDEDARLVDWSGVVKQCVNLPPVLTAALALHAWDAIEPLQHIPWLGRLLAAATLRARGKTRAHLLCLNSGLRAIPWERRRRTSGDALKLQVWLEAITAAAETGLKDHDRWLLARMQLERKLAGRRSTSKLPALIDFVMSQPIASAGMIAKDLGVTPRAAQDMVAELGLREATGRGRYRAWGVI